MMSGDEATNGDVDPQSAVFKIADDGESFSYELWGNDTDRADELANGLTEEIVRTGFAADADRGKIGTALKEALYNAMLHGNLEVDSELKAEQFAPFQDEVDRKRLRKTFQIRSVIVEGRFEADEVRITIRDHGEGFDPEGVADPAEADPTLLHGRGLAMIRAFVDDVLFNESGNAITLVKRR